MTDSAWGYFSWHEAAGTRRAYMGPDADMSDFTIFGENGCTTFNIDGFTMATVDSDFKPAADSTHDLGATGAVWAEVWVDALKSDGAITVTPALSLSSTLTMADWVIVPTTKGVKCAVDTGYIQLDGGLGDALGGAIRIYGISSATPGDIAFLGAAGVKLLYDHSATTWIFDTTQKMQIDQIDEAGAAQGVTIETVLIKDGAIAANYISAGTFQEGNYTFDGDVNVGGNDAGEDRSLRITAPAGQARKLRFETSGAKRWLIEATNAAEGGANAGSDLDIVAYNDAGVAIESALKITRANSLATFGGDVLPLADSSQDLGATGSAWAEVWADKLTSDNAVILNGVGTLTIQVGGATCAQFTGAQIGVYDDVVIQDIDVYQGAATYEFVVSGGSSAILGANLLMRGQTHATDPDDWQLRHDTTVIVGYDASAAEIDFSKDLIPTADSSLDLGKTGAVLAEVWADAIKSDNAISIDGVGDVGVTLTSANEELFLHGVTGSAGGSLRIDENGANTTRLHLFTYSADNSAIVFDAWYDGAWYSADAGSNFLIYKNSDALQFMVDSGVALGGNPVWVQALVINTTEDVSIPNGTLLVDTISESTGAAGVTIDGMLLKDGFIEIADGGSTKIWDGTRAIQFHLDSGDADASCEIQSFGGGGLRIKSAGRIWMRAAGGGWGDSFFFKTTSNLTYAGSDTNFMDGDVTWAPTSGAGTGTMYNWKGTVNQTGTASGDFTCMEVNSIETALLGTNHWILDVTANGTSRFNVEYGGDVNVLNTLKVDTIGEYTGAAGVTIDGLTIKDGAFNEDVLPISDSTLDLGSTGRVWAEVWVDALKSDGSISVVTSDLIMTGGNYIYASVDNSAMGVSGGSSINNGANIVLYGGTHATTASDIAFRQGATVNLYFDASANLWTFADGDTIEIDTINEATAAAGVTIDGVLLKDGNLYLSNAKSIYWDSVQTFADDGTNLYIKSTSAGGSVVFQAGGKNYYPASDSDSSFGLTGQVWAEVWTDAIKADGVLSLQPTGDIELDPTGGDCRLLGSTLGIDNNKYIYMKDAGATYRTVLGVDGGDDLYIGNSTELDDLYIDCDSNQTIYIREGAADVMRLSGSGVLLPNVGSGGQALMVGDAGASSGDRLIDVDGTVTLGTTQYGMVLTPEFDASATSAGRALYVSAETDAAAFTQTNTTGILIAPPIKGAGSTITNLYGLYIDNQSAGGTLNYAIYTNDGAVRLGDDVTVTGKVDITKAGMGLQVNWTDSAADWCTLWNTDGTHADWTSGDGVGIYFASGRRWVIVPRVAGTSQWAKEFWIDLDLLVWTFDSDVDVNGLLDADQLAADHFTDSGAGEIEIQTILDCDQHASGRLVVPVGANMYATR
jgi:hypothetical protein